MDLEHFHLDPNYFPEDTKDLIAIPTILALGALPLGVKKGFRFFKRVRLLNVGLVAPKDRESKKQLKDLAIATGHSSIAPYRVQVPEFLEVLEVIYQVNSETIERMPLHQIHPTITEYFERLKAEEEEAEETPPLT